MPKISHLEGILFYSDKIVILSPFYKQILIFAYEGHAEIVDIKRRRCLKV